MKTGSGDRFADLAARWHVDGDDTARDELLELCTPWLRDFVRPRLGPELRARIESGDVVHDVLVGVLQYGPRFIPRDDRQFFALLGRIVLNRIRDTARGERFRLAERRLDSSGVLRLGLSDRRTVSPAVAASAEEERQTVHLAIELLADQDRRVICMRSLEELEYEEVALALDLTLGATRKRHARALMRLGSILRWMRAGELDRVLGDEAGSDGTR